MSNVRAVHLLALACYALPVPSRAAAEGRYVDASDYVQGDAEVDAWYAMVRALKQEFDDICGDTFCEGEYSNIEALGYRCSVHLDTGRIGACVWTFAASHEEIDPSTGEITVQPKFWGCRTPLAPGTTLAALLSAAAGQSPLSMRLPGSDRSIYDGLIDCL